MVAWLLVAVLLLGSNPAAGFFCAGDCDGDGVVSVDQVLTLVNIALDSAVISTCRPGDANGDGTITIDEIIVALAHALNGCPGARVGGAWLEDQYRLVSSTCSTAVTEALRDGVANLPDCLTRIRVIGPGQVRGTDCYDRAVEGNVDTNGIMTFPLSPRSATQAGCTITETVQVVIDARTDPATARYDSRVTFAGTCAMSACMAVVESRWTLQD